MKDDISPGRGRYDERYATLQSIGKGAFGFVKLAKCRSDNKEVRLTETENSIIFLVRQQ